MSARRDRLGSVLRIRRLQEEAQRGRLLLAQADVSTAAAVAVRRRAAYGELAPLTGDRLAEAFLADRARRTASAAAVLLAQGEQLVAEDNAAVAQQAWSAAARDVDGVERLVERGRLRRFAELMKLEQQATDEAALVRRVAR